MDNLAAETAASLTTKHPDYAKLAARIAVSNLHKTTSKSFSNTMKRLYTYIDPKTGESASLISTDVYGLIKKNAALLDSSIIYDRDFSYDYFGFKTLERSYLMRLDGKVVERPMSSSRAIESLPPDVATSTVSPGRKKPCFRTSPRKARCSVLALFFIAHSIVN